MARKTFQRPEPSLWSDSRSSTLPKPKPAPVRSAKRGKGRVERCSALEAILEAGPVSVALLHLKSIGVGLKLSGACIEVFGVTTEVPYPKTVADWIRKNGTEIRRIVNGTEQA